MDALFLIVPLGVILSLIAFSFLKKEPSQRRNQKRLVAYQHLV